MELSLGSRVIIALHLSTWPPLSISPSSIFSLGFHGSCKSTDTLSSWKLERELRKSHDLSWALECGSPWISHSPLRFIAKPKYLLLHVAKLLLRSLLFLLHPLSDSFDHVLVISAERLSILCNLFLSKFSISYGRFLSVKFGCNMDASVSILLSVFLLKARLIILVSSYPAILNSSALN